MILTVLAAGSVTGAELRTLSGHVPTVVPHLRPAGQLIATNRLDLALGLPLRNQAALDELIRGLYDPASPNYHHFLTPDQFTTQFGPTEADYQALQDFARSNGLAVTHTHGNRVLLDVRGTVSDIENAFHVRLRTYPHPVEARSFYAPDTEPTVPKGLPVLDISGLSDYARPQPSLRPCAAAGGLVPASGSGPSGLYMGTDFRKAYVPGCPLDGSGQRVGLLELTGYNSSDITAYETQAGLPNVPLQNVYLDGADGSAGSANAEVCVDIELAIAMATNLAAVVVFEAPNSATYWNDILNAMASSNQIRQFSSSWGFSFSPSATSDQIFQQMAVQGQSFFQASGDGDAWTSAIWQPAESPYLTVVGGTELAMNGTGGAYASETVWNAGYLGTNNVWSLNGNGYWGSGGGVSGYYAIPAWQTNLNTAANQASATKRNIPDVAASADQIYVTYGGGLTGGFMGTSCAAPLWAGFMALVNEQAAILSRPPVGFINPAIYALARSTNYSACFHDIVVGSNTWSGSPTNYYAVPGYDLCTGLGTPAGTNLIAALTATTTYDRQQLVWNGGFETGYFTSWTLYGRTVVQMPRGPYIYNGVESSSYGVAHSGSYGVLFGDSSLAVLAQTLPTQPGQKYLLSFWLINPSGGSGQQFQVNWNTNAPATNTIFSLSSPPVMAWSNYNFVVTATGTNTILQFGAANPPNYFGLDDVSVTAIPAPAIAALASATNGLAMTWSTLANVGYAVQYKTDLAQTSWQTLGGTNVALTNTMTFVDTNRLGNTQRFYRVTAAP